MNWIAVAVSVVRNSSARARIRSKLGSRLWTRGMKRLAGMRISAAKRFAAEILMPASLFIPRVHKREPSFDLIRALADEFRTTLTATAIQFIRYTKEECVLVASKGGHRQWFTASD